jgi:hypothetical protein
MKESSALGQSSILLMPATVASVEFLSLHLAEDV